MTITTELLDNKRWVNSTVEVNFTIASNNGIIRVRSNSGTTTVSKDNGSGTFLTYFTVAVGESKAVENCFKGNYKISGTDFNYEYAD